MYGDFQSQVASQLEAIRAAGTFKRERVIVSPQDARIRREKSPRQTKQSWEPSFASPSLARFLREQKSL